MILALLTIGSLIFYFVTVRPTGDLQLIGTVDANEVMVSARIPGRIQTLTVKEGDPVQAGQLISVIESDDLDAALQAAEAAAASQSSKLSGSVETEEQNQAKPPAPQSARKPRYASHLELKESNLFLNPGFSAQIFNSGGNQPAGSKWAASSHRLPWEPDTHRPQAQHRARISEYPNCAPESTKTATGPWCGWKGLG